MTWCYRLAAFAVAVAIGGCSSNAAIDPQGVDTGGGGEGASDGAAVTFAEPSPLSVAPGQKIELTVRTDPPGAYQVSFLLLGDSLDASLDRPGSPTDEGGAAAVELLAPSKAASFKVRAAVGDTAGTADTGSAGVAEIVIQVSEIGLGSLRITPDYRGNRETTTWRAAVLPQSQCEDFAPPSEPEGAVVVEAPDGEDLVIDNAIVGPSLAVLVRSDHKVWGCAETSLTHAGESKGLTVPVLDRPLDLSTTALDVSLLLSDPSSDLEATLRAADDELVDAAFPADEPAASVLLDAIRDRIPMELEALFDEVRESYELDDEVGADLGARDVDIRLLVDELLRAGRPLPPLFLTGRISSAEADATHALLRVETFAGVPGQLAGVPAEHLLSFVANPGDTVVIGAESGIYFFPTRLVGALAEKAALADEPAGTAFSAVLADAVGCLDLADVVGPLGDCDAACVEASCRLALGDIWSASLDASAEAADLGVLTLVVSGQGVVDEEAALVAFEPSPANSWVGELRAVELIASIGGTAVAVEADEDTEQQGGAGPTGGNDDDGGDDGAGVGGSDVGSGGAEP
jgi:hypothetical protein